MSVFEMKYTLVQQTPLIHFQHDEDGATLRATEVKPKLDRFLIERAAAGEVKDDWFVKRDRKKGALDYKMRIEAVGSRDNKRNIKNYRFYFANMGENAVEKQVVFHDRHKLTIVCFIKELREKIEGCIEDFFILHNFGTRQTKGFGGFLVKHSNDNIPYDAARIQQAFKGLPWLKFHVQHTHYTDENHPCADEKAFHLALAVYNVMKGGFNQTGYNKDRDEYGYLHNRVTKRFDREPGSQEEKERISKRYIKGFVQRAYLPDNTGSDKSFIKQSVVWARNSRSGSNSREPSHQYDKYVFVRALLGLADHYEFRDDMRPNSKAQIFQFTDVTQPQQITESHIKDKNKVGIERFASPICIRIFACSTEGDYDVYFVFRNTYLDILGKTFILISEYYLRNAGEAKEKAKALREHGKVISVPAEFDPKAFLREFIRYFEDKKSIFSNFDEPLKSAKDITLEGGEPQCLTPPTSASPSARSTTP